MGVCHLLTEGRQAGRQERLRSGLGWRGVLEHVASDCTVHDGGHPEEAEGKGSNMTEDG